jgi:predicted MPP superfamily phosphohydrolase
MVNRRNVLAGIVGGLVTARAARAEERERQSWAFDVNDVSIVVKGLDPAHDGLRIGQLSDIHVGPHTPDGRVIGAVNALNDMKPDLVVLTGDYVTRKGDPLERVPELLARLQGKVYAVLGNHDHWTDAKTVKRDLQSCGFHVLQNEHTTVRVKGARLTIFGIDDGVTKRACIPSTWKGAPGTGSRLVLAHSPPTADQLPQAEGLACLAGHTHGGQIYLGPVTERVFLRAGQPYVRGLYQVNGNTLYVNRGLGFGRGTPLPRVGSEPEVALITLRAA